MAAGRSGGLLLFFLPACDSATAAGWARHCFLALPVANPEIESFSNWPSNGGTRGMDAAKPGAARRQLSLDKRLSPAKLFHIPLLDPFSSPTYFCGGQGNLTPLMLSHIMFSATALPNEQASIDLGSPEQSLADFASLVPLGLPIDPQAPVRVTNADDPADEDSQAEDADADDEMDDGDKDSGGEDTDDGDEFDEFDDEDFDDEFDDDFEEEFEDEYEVDDNGFKDPADEFEKQDDVEKDAG